MVMLASKAMGTFKGVEVTEWSVLMFGVFYHSGRWNVNATHKMVKREWRMYERGIVSEDTENFCIDFLSGRLPPNRLATAYNQIECFNLGRHIQVH